MTSTLPDVYKKNLEVLKKHHPHIWSTVVDDTVIPTGKVVSASNGSPNLKVQSRDDAEVFLHDKKNPELEISDVLNVVPEASTGVVVLIGMGLGYMIPALLEQRPTIRHLVVFDLGPGIFKQALTVMDLSRPLADHRLILSLDENPNLSEVFAPADKALLLENIHRVQHQLAFEANPVLYQSLAESVYEYISGRNIVGNTEQKYGHRFIANRLTILKSIHHHHLLESLQRCFAGKPAIMVAGGPSLDKNIHLLPTLKSKAIIIAVDTVLPTLLERNITPHFITSIDPHPITYEKYAQFAKQAKGISLIAAPYVSPKVHQCFPADHIFWTFSGKPMEQWMNTMLGGEVATTGSSTCAHLNLTAAITMGCDPIVFIGQDLAFSEYKDHADGVILNNPEVAQKQSLQNNPDAIWVDGYHGDKVPSNRGFLSMKLHFENMMAANPGPRYINATEGGAHLSGTETVSLATVVKELCFETLTVKPAIEETLRQNDPISTQSLIKKIHHILNQTQNLSKIVSRYNQLITTIRHLLKKNTIARSACSPETLPTFMQKKIAQAETLEKKMDGGDHMQIWKILEEGTMEEVKESERTLHKIKSPTSKNPERFVANFITNLDRLLTLNMARDRILSFFQQELMDIIHFHESESFLIKSNDSRPNKGGGMMDLVQHHFNNQLYSSAKLIIDQSQRLNHNDEIHFYKGAIAAWQSDFELSTSHFKKIKPNSEFVDKKNAFKHHLGSRYLKIALEYKRGAYSQITRKMLFKGIRIDQNHEGLIDEIQKMATSDLALMVSCLSADCIQDSRHIVSLWHHELCRNPNLPASISKMQAGNFFHLNSLNLYTQNDVEGALDSLDKGLQYTPNHPALLATAAEIFFSIADYPNGITYLNRAVDIDPSHAVIWEQLGDRLAGEGVFTDAITAYEQGATVLTENLHLLKKIGDCYRKNGQLEAAKEVYQMVKQGLSNT